MLQPDQTDAGGEGGWGDAYTEAPSSSSSSASCCANEEGGGGGVGGWPMTLFTWFTYFTVVGDLTDAGLDYAYVAQLAKYPDTAKHAAWLGVCTTIALLLELAVKTGMRRQKDEDTKVGGGDFNMNDKQGRSLYIMFCGLMELCIFCFEDATTLFIW